MSPRIASIIGILLFAVPVSAASPSQILGTWLTANGQSKIEIAPCDDRYCGTIAWMRTPRNDERNEDPAKRGRPLVGARIMTGFKYDGGSTWTGGKLYAPERGKAVDAKLVLTGDDALEVRASAGIARRTVTWTRVK
jgi:uncharacterized protein (DUF2147 family)